MYKIIAIIGESGTGKDTLQRQLCEKEKLNGIVSTTTRPAREGEIDGENYHFTTDNEFAQKILNGEILEATSFNGWTYGTEKKALSENEINIGVFNPSGIEALQEDGSIELFTIRLKCNPKTRMVRALNREENPDVEEIARRFLQDMQHFSELNFPYFSCSSEDEIDLEILLENANLHFGL